MKILTIYDIEGNILHKLKIPNNTPECPENFQLTSAIENVAEINKTLFKANLSRRILRRINLYNVDLRLVNLQYTDLSHANLVKANLEGANLSCSNLQGTNLKGANLIGTDLSNADLEYARLEGAYIYKDVYLLEHNYLSINTMIGDEEIPLEILNINKGLYFRLHRKSILELQEFKKGILSKSLHDRIYRAYLMAIKLAETMFVI